LRGAVAQPAPARPRGLDQGLFDDAPGDEPIAVAAFAASGGRKNPGAAVTSPLGKHEALSVAPPNDLDDQCERLAQLDSRGSHRRPEFDVPDVFGVESGWGWLGQGFDVDGDRR